MSGPSKAEFDRAIRAKYAIKLDALRQRRAHEIVSQFYHPTIVSIMLESSGPRSVRGLEAVTQLYTRLAASGSIDLSMTSIRSDVTNGLGWDHANYRIRNSKEDRLFMVLTRWTNEDADWRCYQEFAHAGPIEA